MKELCVDIEYSRVFLKAKTVPLTQVAVPATSRDLARIWNLFITYKTNN